MSTKSFEQIMYEKGTERMSTILDGINDQGLSFLANGPQDTRMDLGVTPSSLTYSTAENSYSGTDVTVAIIYNEEIVILGNVSTITYSIHREKMPVRTLGRTYPKDYVRGQRTIAGSCIFVQFNESPLYMLYKFFKGKKLENEHRFSSPLADEIPPFDMMFIFENEYGKNSIIRMYGVEITDEGGTYSINDIYSENVMQFLARDIDPMISSSEDDAFKKLMYQKMTQGKILDPHYNSLLEYKVLLEQRLADTDRRMAEIYDLASSNLRRRSRAQVPLNSAGEFDGDRDDLNRSQTRNLNRMEAKREYDSLLRQKNRIIEELNNLNTSVARYEQTRMTWDMNSALESTSSASFVPTTAAGNN